MIASMLETTKTKRQPDRLSKAKNIPAFLLTQTQTKYIASMHGIIDPQASS
jgi:hypothetical protein